MTATQRGSSTGTETESAVKERYSAAAVAREAALCCPVDYDPQYLRVIPQEVLDRDYGCGDPSRYVREGEIVGVAGVQGNGQTELVEAITGLFGALRGFPSGRAGQSSGFDLFGIF